MEIMQVIGLGIAAALILGLLRKERPELGAMAALVAAVSIFLMVLPSLKSVVTVFADLSREAGLAPVYFAVIMKVLAISYIADFGAALCRDAGEELLASRVEMAGKVLIMVASFPVVKAVLDIIKGLLE